MKNFKEIPKQTILFISLAISLLLMSIWISLFIDTGSRFLQDNMKIFIYVFSIIIIAPLINSKILLNILQGMTIILPFVLIFYILYIIDTDLFSYADRLYLPYFGSPNVLGSIAAICILILFFSKNILNIIKIIFISFYSSIVVLGFSRAVIIGLVIVFIINRQGRKVLTYLTIILLFLILILLSLNLITIPDWVFIKLGMMDGTVSIYEDARLIVWNATLTQIFDSTSSFLFGSLPGKGIIILPGHINMTMHPHNTYLFVLWGYGIIGLVLFLTSIIFLIYKLQNESTYGDLKKSLLLFYIIVFLMDTYILAGQFLILHILVWSFLYSNNSYHKKFNP